YLFSDGTFEIGRPDGSMLDFTEFQDALSPPDFSLRQELGGLLDFARRVHGEATLEDDFSIVRLEVPARTSAAPRTLSLAAARSGCGARAYSRPASARPAAPPARCRRPNCDAGSRTARRHRR